MRALLALIGVAGLTFHPAPRPRSPASSEIHRYLRRQWATARADPRSLIAAAEREMSAFQRLVAQSAGGLALRGFSATGIQHLLASTGVLMRGLVDSGISNGDLCFMGKTYSQHPGVIGDLHREGFGVYAAKRESAQDLRVFNGGIPPPASMRGQEHLWSGYASFDVAGMGWEGWTAGGDTTARRTELRARVEYLLRQRPLDDPGADPAKQKWLIVDDGGDLIELINDEYPELHGRVVAVEQTRKGIRKVQAIEREGRLRIPVINVAESWAKLNYESPMIGRSIALTASARLGRLAIQGVDFTMVKQASGRVKRVLLVGYGTVGSAAARAFHAQGYDVEVADTSLAAREQAERDGFRVHERLVDGLRRTKVVVSLTGTRTLDDEALEAMPDGSILINAASSSTEIMPALLHVGRGLVMNSLVGDRLFGNFQGKRIELGRLPKGGYPPTGIDWVVELPSKKRLLLANQGEVVNFDGTPDPIPGRYIQLTRGLLYLGALQAARTTSPRIHDLEEAPQRAWVEAVQAQLALTHESLLDPTFL